MCASPHCRRVVSDLVTLVERTVRSHPDKHALELPDRSLTYRELWSSAHAVATLLGVAPGRVGLRMVRGSTACISYLGILRAAGTVVPLNPAHPLSRNLRIVELAGLETILVDGPLSAEV